MLIVSYRMLLYAADCSFLTLTAVFLQFFQIGNNYLQNYLQTWSGRK